MPNKTNMENVIECIRKIGFKYSDVKDIMEFDTSKLFKYYSKYINRSYILDNIDNNILINLILRKNITSYNPVDEQDIQYIFLKLNSFGMIGCIGCIFDHMLYFKYIEEINDIYDYICFGMDVCILCSAKTRGIDSINNSSNISPHI